MTTALAKGSHVLTRILADNPDATAIHLYSGRQLESWLQGKEAQETSERRAVKQANGRARRRPVPTLPPRLMSREDAAAYCNCSLSTFDDWVRRGIIPRLVPGTHRWDRVAIDRALDKAAGLINDESESEYGAWKKHANKT
jgi:hypothetical protein